MLARSLSLNYSKGLAAVPNVGDNGVHASASPFEALAERANWLGADVKTDNFGKALIAAGVTEETIKAWSVDPQVILDRWVLMCACAYKWLHTTP